MAPNDGDALECNGTFNPAVIRGPDGQLYLFPRIVGEDGRSRIGICRVIFDPEGDPVGVERLGIALQPEAPYEVAPGSGCEDPRVAYVDPLGCYIMTYTAAGPDLDCPQIAFAASDDLLTWERLGVARFEPAAAVDFCRLPNKNAIVFPNVVTDPDGNPAIAMIHRPLFPGVGMDLLTAVKNANGSGVSRDSLWLSFSALRTSSQSLREAPVFSKHYRLPIPELGWNRLRIGGGAPPLKTENGYLIFYHGVSDAVVGLNGWSRRYLVYSAGAFILDEQDLRVVTHHSEAPWLSPAVAEELDGFVPSVVFPTGTDRRIDIGCPERIDVYYGMADHRIGVARIDVRSCAFAMSA
jgi:predicted GH43/DUF377 family glycosyl hydrolase